ncbi:MAG: quinolinate synthase [Chloroflexi bacterium RBG_13_60_13]|nr:MAG: quinolinate synthase [Chloroflexi bacterium RBG_13_60_13]
MENHRSLLENRIQKLRKERNAVILAHNYQLGEVQDIADFVGDSLELSQKAARTDARVIVFCGVHFMAETASILSPNKSVLLPVMAAGCPMANMVTAEDVRRLRREHPKAIVVCYVNTTAEVKAESDVCCTSANGVQLVQKLEADEIIFVPDQYLGHHISTQTGKKMILWPGYCPTHVRIQAADVHRIRAIYPRAEVMVHPECRPDVVALADFVLSTGGMIRHASSTDASELVVGTEIGILHRLRKENPGKAFIPLTEQAVCPNMKLIGLDSILWSLEEMTPEVKVAEDIRLRARKAVDRMIGIA